MQLHLVIIRSRYRIDSCECRPRVGFPNDSTDMKRGSFSMAIITVGLYNVKFRFRSADYSCGSMISHISTKQIWRNNLPREANEPTSSIIEKSLRMFCFSYSFFFRLTSKAAVEMSQPVIIVFAFLLQPPSD